MGEDTGRMLGVGQRVLVRIVEAVPVSGGLIFELLEVEGNALPRGTPRKGRRAQPRLPGKSKRKAAKANRKARRSRT